jgi:hypothetical protein
MVTVFVDVAASFVRVRVIVVGALLHDLVVVR